MSQLLEIYSALIWEKNWHNPKSERGPLEQSHIGAIQPKSNQTEH